jgi:hypothetical protein
MAFDVEEPAVIAAADAALLDAPVVERRPTMHAARIQKACVPRAIPKKHEILT